MTKHNFLNLFLRVWRPNFHVFFYQCGGSIFTYFLPVWGPNFYSFCYQCDGPLSKFLTLWWPNFNVFSTSVVAQYSRIFLPVWWPNFATIIGVLSTSQWGILSENPGTQYEQLSKRQRGRKSTCKSKQTEKYYPGKVNLDKQLKSD